MKTSINPGNMRRSLTLIDNIVYSRQKDINGNDMELKLSILLQNGNSEMKAAVGDDEPGEDHSPKPALLWIPGGGWRGTDKNLMLGEMYELADAGYVVASMYYRSIAEGVYPAQIKDVKTAIRFLRANAANYEIVPDHIGVMGRSAGGHLAALAAMNTDEYDSEEWQGYSSAVQACCNMFGPTDMVDMLKMEMHNIETRPNYRWKTLEDTHGGALLGGGTPDIFLARAKEASVVEKISDAMCPMMILHGDNDPVIPMENSSDILYEKITAAGLEERIQYYVVKNGGHGSREFFQPQVKTLMLEFFNKHLR
ncbi:MAG: alpha/beta hydrolase fold domain-containing protein [Lachnospiraceae bacterium]